MVADSVIDFGTLAVCPAEISAAEGAEILARPFVLYQPGGQVLRIGSHVERAVGRAPNLPGRGRARQLLLEPRFLLAAEHAVGGLVLAEIGRALVSDGDRRGRIATSIVLARIDDLHQLLRNTPGSRESNTSVSGRSPGFRIV